MYDIVFISYQEPNADENYKRLKKRFPLAKRVHGIKGIHNAHVAAAKKCFTKMFWAVDGDAFITDNMMFDYVVDEYNLDTVHVWRSLNPVNDLVYGYGGVKLLPRKLTIGVDTTTSDMTTSISNKFKAVPFVSNITKFDTSPYEAWKGAFRECAKLSSRVIARQKDKETQQRLDTWCTIQNGEFGHYAVQGAIAGKKFGQGDNDILLINNFDWLQEQFDANTQ